MENQERYAGWAVSIAGVSILFGVATLLTVFLPETGSPSPISDYACTAWLVFWRCLMLAALCLAYERLEAIYDRLRVIAVILSQRPQEPPPLR